MSVLGIGVGIALVVACLIVIVFPILFETSESNATFRDKQRERALAYYERVLTNLRDLDDDLATGKIHRAEYNTERELWMSRGEEILHLLDELDQKHNVTKTLKQNASDADIDDAIERAIADHRAQAHAVEVG